MKIGIFIILVQSLQSCGESKLSCTVPSFCVTDQDENAMLMLKNAQYDEAQSVLEKLIADNPTEYFRYPRLAMVYALQGGVDMMDIFDAQQNRGETGIDMLIPKKSSVTEEVFTASVAKVRLSRSTLTAVPTEIWEDTTVYYNRSIRFQFGVYSFIFSDMLFQLYKEGELFDPSKVATLTEDGAVEIRESMASAETHLEELLPPVSILMATQGALIDSQSGSTTHEKVTNYMLSLSTDE